jgi:GNAT superfamily N-acetyltransferase
LDEIAYSTRYPKTDSQRIAEAYAESRRDLPSPLSEDSVVFVVETADEDFAGFIWAVEEADPHIPGSILLVFQLAVHQRYQGMGLGAMLVKRMIVEARDGGYHRLRGDLSGTGLQLAGFFRELGFQPVSQIMELDPTYWEE